MQRITQNGRPIIDRTTSLPLYRLPVHLRIKNIKRELYDNGSMSHEDRWNNIVSSVKQLQF